MPGENKVVNIYCVILLLAMSVVGGKLIKGSFNPSECAPHVKGSVCSRSDDVQKLRKFLSAMDPTLDQSTLEKMPSEKVISTIKQIIGVNTESAIYDSQSYRSFIGTEEAEKTLAERFNPAGPWDTTHRVELLNDRHIDTKQEQWARLAPKLYRKKYYNVPFQMIDFDHPNPAMKTELALLSIPKLIQHYDCMGVVLNTDIRSGPGKHWFCIYCDFQHAGTAKDPYTLEFFNSSGNPPMREVADWLNKTKHDLLRAGKHAVIVKSASEQLQYSDTECGVWSLMYIQFRLEGKPPSFFVESKALDDDMLKFRKALFRHN